ncbi:MAG: iron donor protein CyaY [Deltaproteobacteria bacterium]|nr:iron donor protein CyaY [Deltaproteobacteria bacterium]
MATSDTLDEPAFRTLANAAIERVRGAIDAEDPDAVEAVLEAGVLKLQFPSGAPFVLNLQPPIRELWLAADRSAWHFRYDGARWLDKKSGVELYATLRGLVGAKIGREPAL